MLGGGLDVLETRADVPVRVADLLRFGKRGRALEDVEGRARVTARERDEMLERVIGQRDAAGRPERTGQAAFLVAQRPADDGPDLVVGQWLEPPDAHPRQESSVHLEVRVLGRRADERDRPVLDVRQEGVLLGLVEAVDLVEEEEAPRPVQIESFLGLGDRRADLDDPGHDRRHAAEVGADLGCEEAREAGLAGPRWAPQQERCEMPTSHAPTQRTTLADEVLLPDELGQVARSHPGGQRLPLGRRLEESLGSGPFDASRAWHGSQSRARCLRDVPSGRVWSQARLTLGSVKRPRAALLGIVFLVAACGQGPAPSLGEGGRTWCGGHPIAVVNAGVGLGIGPSHFVSEKAGIEQATLDGDVQQAQRLLLQLERVAAEIATDTDPHPGLTSLAAWRADAPADFEKSCLAAYAAGSVAG